METKLSDTTDVRLLAQLFSFVQLYDYNRKSIDAFEEFIIRTKV